MRTTLGKITNESLDELLKSKHCLRSQSTDLFFFFFFFLSGSEERRGVGTGFIFMDSLQIALFSKMHVAINVIFEVTISFLSHRIHWIKHIFPPIAQQHETSRVCRIQLILCQQKFFDRCSQYGVSCLVGNCVYAGKHIAKGSFVIEWLFINNSPR